MQNKHTKEIFFWPALLGVISAIGLVMALLEEGVIEYVSLIGLVVPILVIIYFYCIKK